MSREIATVNYIIHHDYFHIGIKEQASDQFPDSTAAVVNYIIQSAYFHFEIKEELSDALEPGRRSINGIRVLVTNTSLMEPVKL